MNSPNNSRDLDDYLIHFHKLPFERNAERYRRRAILGALAQISPTSVVEIGCGLMSIFHDLDSGITGTIIEPIPELLRLQSHLDRQCTMHQARLEEVSPELESLNDCVILSSIIHEVEEPSEFVRKAINWLRPKGKVICVVPNGLSIHRYVGLQKGMLSALTSRTTTQDEMQQFQDVYTPESLKELMTECGLKTISLTSFFPKLLSHSQMQDLLDLGVIDDKFLDQLFEMSEACGQVGSEILYVGEKNEI